MTTIEETVEKIRLGEESKEVLYDKIINFIKCQEKKFSGYTKDKILEKGDISSLVWLGIEKAIVSYNPETEAKFLSWARVCIKYMIMNEFKAQKTEEVSLDLPVLEGEGAISEIIPDDESFEEFQKAERKIDGRRALDALKTLPEEERKVVTLSCIKNIPLARVARGMGISVGHARSVKLSALRKLREMIM